MGFFYLALTNCWSSPGIVEPEPVYVTSLLVPHVQPQKQNVTQEVCIRIIEEGNNISLVRGLLFQQLLLYYNVIIPILHPC